MDTVSPYSPHLHIYIYIFGLKSIQKPWRLQRKAWSWRPYFNSNCREPQGTAVVIEAPSALGTREGRITFARKNGTQCWPHVESTSFQRLKDSKGPSLLCGSQTWGTSMLLGISQPRLMKDDMDFFSASTISAP